MLYRPNTPVIIPNCKFNRPFYLLPAALYGSNPSSKQHLVPVCSINLFTIGMTRTKRLAPAALPLYSPASRLSTKQSRLLLSRADDGVSDMKRLWTHDDLLAQWTLQPSELALVEYKEGTHRLGFALLLKYFQIDGRFPRQKHDVPVLAIAFVASQLDVSIDLYPAYDWDGRTIKQHRADIRAFLGFRESTTQDYDEMIATL